VTTKTGLGPVFYVSGLPDMFILRANFPLHRPARITQCTKNSYKTKRISHSLVEKHSGNWSNRDSDKSNNYPLNEALAQNHFDK